MDENPVVTDARGRKITLRILGPAEMLDLIEAMPAVAAGNYWLSYAQIMHSVAQIDDLPIPPPDSKEKIKHIARLLGNEGVAAVSDYINGPATSPGEDAEKIKN